MLALAASLLHLGHPVQAWLALTNVRTSWLSREVLLAAAFVACLLVTALLGRTRAGSPGVHGLMLVGAVVGVLAVAAMSRLYMVPTQPAWDRIVTPVSFFATTLLLGIVVVLLLVAPGWNDLVHARPLGRALPFVGIALLVLQLVLLPAWVRGIVAEPAAAISAASLGSVATWLAAVRAVAAIVAIVMIAVSSRPMPVVPAAGAVALLVFVFASEVCGRLLFYASSVHLGPV
jgi:anaerobic dimethyl sulfoxide reductase subunit C (anchor subunit)